MLQQSGVVSYRVRDGAIEILLVKTSSSKTWALPKGWIPLGTTAANSAAKEAWEEAGVCGIMENTAIASYTTRKWGCVCRVKIFLMRVTQEFADYPEIMQRQRQWMSIAEAIQQVEKKKIKRILEQVQQQEEMLRQKY